MWKVRREVPKFNKDGSRAKKDAVQYQCNVCSVWTKSKAIAVDHIVPVVSVQDGFIDWNTFVERLFCDASNLQVICDSCHNSKTNQERFERSFKQEALECSRLRSLLSKEEDIKAFVKKYTPKRLAKFPYPQDFKNHIAELKLRVVSKKLLKKD